MIAGQVQQLRRNLRLRFDDPALEQRYRRAVLPRDRQALQAILLVAALFQLLNFATDGMIVTESGSLTALRWLRGLGAVASFAGIATIGRIRDPFRFELLAAVWGVITATTAVASFALLPRDYIAHTAWSVLLVLAMYAALPLRLPRQAMVAIVFTIGDVVILTWFKDLNRPAERFDIFTAHACAHMVGLVASWQFKRARRDQFLAVRAAEHAHTQEQRAWGEVNVLQGILPICAGCKRIRGETGEWSPLESYVQRHSEADFSHGICPDCEHRMYGDLPTRNGAP